MQLRYTASGLEIFFYNYISAAVAHELDPCAITQWYFKIDFKLTCLNIAFGVAYEETEAVIQLNVICPVNLSDVLILIKDDIFYVT